MAVLTLHCGSLGVLLGWSATNQISTWESQTSRTTIHTKGLDSLRMEGNFYSKELLWHCRIHVGGKKKALDKKRLILTLFGGGVSFCNANWTASTWRQSYGFQSSTLWTLIGWFLLSCMAYQRLAICTNTSLTSKAGTGQDAGIRITNRSLFSLCLLVIQNVLVSMLGSLYVM